MQWIQTENADPIHSWVLLNVTAIAELKFSPASKTIRLFASDIRQFFLEASGKLQQRIIITSEYGILLGEFQYATHLQDGSVYLNQQRYIYREENAGIVLMDASGQPVMDCQIMPATDLNVYEMAALVFGLLWVWQTIELKAPAIALEKNLSS